MFRGAKDESIFRLDESSIVCTDDRTVVRMRDVIVTRTDDGSIAHLDDRCGGYMVTKSPVVVILAQVIWAQVKHSLGIVCTRDCMCCPGAPLFVPVVPFAMAGSRTRKRRSMAGPHPEGVPRAGIRQLLAEEIRMAF